MTEHLWSSIVQSKAWRCQAAIGWLHSGKAEIDQPDLGIVGLAFVQQILQRIKLIFDPVFGPCRMQVSVSDPFLHVTSSTVCVLNTERPEQKQLHHQDAVFLGGGDCGPKELDASSSIHKRQGKRQMGHTPQDSIGVPV